MILKWLLKPMWFLVMLVVVIATLFWLQSDNLAPPGKRVLQIAGLKDSVRIMPDAAGLLTITASAELDVITGLGFAAAEQHLWQMAMMRRSARGRLSEWFGGRTLQFDLYFRNLRLDSLATQLYQYVSPESREWSDAYAAGVNSYLASAEGQLPMAFQVLGVTVEAWRGADVFLLLRYLAWATGERWKKQLARQLLGMQLLPQLPGEPPLADLHDETLLNEITRLWEIEQEYRRWWGFEIDVAQSGMICLGDSLSPMTESRMAAVNPLALNLPFSWMKVHLKAEDIDAAGLAIPGIPGIWIGGGAQGSWAGIATGRPDLTFRRLATPFTAQDVPAMRRYRQAVRVGPSKHLNYLLVGNAQWMVWNPSADDSRQAPAMSISWGGWPMSDELRVMRALLVGGTPRAVDAAAEAWSCPSLQLHLFQGKGNIHRRDLYEKAPPAASAALRLKPWSYYRFFSGKAVVEALAPDSVKQHAAPASGLHERLQFENEKFPLPGSLVDVLLRNENRLRGDLLPAAEMDRLLWILAHPEDAVDNRKIGELVADVWRYKLYADIISERKTGPDLTALLSNYYPLMNEVLGATLEEATASRPDNEMERRLLDTFVKSVVVIKSSCGDRVFRWRHLDLMTDLASSFSIIDTAQVNFYRYLGYSYRLKMKDVLQTGGDARDVRYATGDSDDWQRHIASRVRSVHAADDVGIVTLFPLLHFSEIHSSAGAWGYILVGTE